MNQFAIHGSISVILRDFLPSIPDEMIVGDSRLLAKEGTRNPFVSAQTDVFDLRVSLSVALDSVVIDQQIHLDLSIIICRARCVCFCWNSSRLSAALSQFLLAIAMHCMFSRFDKDFSWDCVLTRRHTDEARHGYATKSFSSFNWLTDSRASWGLNQSVLSTMTSWQ